MNLKTLPFQVSQEIVDLALADSELQRRHKREMVASNKALWAEVHKQYPELDKDGEFVLNCAYAEQGIVMLDISDKDDSDTPRRKLAQLLGSLVKDVN